MMSENIDPAVNTGLETISKQLKDRILSSGKEIKTIDDLNEAIEQEKGGKRTVEKFTPEISTAASAMECTGLMPSMPENSDEYRSYQELYSMETPKKADNGTTEREKN